jgi:hypothetical protein
VLLALEDVEQAVAGREAAEDKKDPAGGRARAEKRRTNRGALPAYLPHVDVTIAPEDTNCPCCREPMHVIGEETSKRLDVIPAQFRVIVTHRPKYSDAAHLTWNGVRRRQKSDRPIWRLSIRPAARHGYLGVQRPGLDATGRHGSAGRQESPNGL